MSTKQLPRILVIDDLLGRSHPDRRNEERANFCGQYLIDDVTGDEQGKPSQKIRGPVAQAVFCRALRPSCSVVGDTVESDLERTVSIIREGWLNPSVKKPRWAMVLLDLCFYTGRVTDESNRRCLGMPEGCEEDSRPQSYFGLKILEAIHRECPELPVIILSSQPKEDVSYEYTRNGALAFLPRDSEDGAKVLKDYLWRHGLVGDDSGEIVGQSLALLLSLRNARRTALQQQSILIRGERGTGKEMLAHYIHRQSAESGRRPLVIVNSGGVQRELYSSELFGHVRGAFTSGTSNRDGAILSANGGDLFFDEIGNMPEDAQGMVLRVLESGTFNPVGSDEAREVSVRFLSATNEDIEGLASFGRFRADLLDRLRKGGTVFLPPLRERQEDLPVLVERFLREAERDIPGALYRKVDPQVMEMIVGYPWPGNIRELGACIWDAVRNFPNVEHLVPLHIQFPGVQIGSTVLRPMEAAPKPEARLEPVEDTAGQNSARTLDDVIHRVASFRFDPQRENELAGKFPRLQKALARLLTGYCKAALVATGRNRPAGEGKLEREVLIHPAMKLITGDGKLSASQAADLIKRIVRLFPEGEAAVKEDPVLKEAYETAVRLRPRQSKKTKPQK